MSLVDAAPDETALEAGGHAKGVAVAVVRENKDDSGLGRVKVSYPWHSQPRESYWARVAVPMAGDKRGTWFLPENRRRSAGRVRARRPALSIRRRIALERCRQVARRPTRTGRTTSA